MKKGLRQVLILVSILAIALTIGPAMAGAKSQQGQGGSPHGYAYGHFKDLFSGHWAYRDVTMMQVKKIFLGYSDGRFGPQDPVTRIQLVCLAVRVAGQERAALALGPEAVAAALGEFADGASLPTWAGARECFAYAYENGYLFGLTYQEQETFRAGEPATRLEVVVTLLEAIGKHDEAAGLTDATITAPDAAEVPDWAHGYVALALQMGLLKGDENGYLNLDAGVTRAQMAALLARANAQCPSDADRLVVQGTVVAVTAGDAPSITIETESREIDEYEEDEEDSTTGDDEGDQGEDEGTVSEDEGGESDETLVQVTYPISSDALIFVDGKPATLADIVAGTRVELRIEDGVVVLIDAKADEGEQHGRAYSLQGTLDAVSDTAMTITVTAVDCEEEGAPDVAVGDQIELAFAGEVDCKWRGENVLPTVIPLGSSLEVRVRDGLVDMIRVRENEEAGKVTLEGTFVAADADSLTMVITKVRGLGEGDGNEDEDENDDEGDDEGDENAGATGGEGASTTYVVGQEITLPLSAAVQIVGLDSGALADLEVGTELEVTILDGVVVTVTVGDTGHGKGNGKGGR